jgi:hypothetical protein
LPPYVTARDGRELNYAARTALLVVTASLKWRRERR